jgi:glycosyltransferase involved in cell wall biosynthesis
MLMRRLAVRSGLPNRIDPFFSVDQIIAPIYSFYLLICGRPYAFTLHDLQEKHLPTNFNLIRRSARQIANVSLTRAAARIVCESAYVASDIRIYYPWTEGKISVIAAPPQRQFCNAVPETLLSQVKALYQLPDEYLFFPAQFFAHKNHIRLIDAFASVLIQYPNCHLVFTGKKIHEYGNVMAHVAARDLSHRVLHLGHLPDDHMASVYKLATAVVVPTLFESISIPVYEAFGIGTAVCVSNVLAIPEQVGDAALLFDPYSVEDMATVICKALASEDLRRQLISKGKARIATMTISRYACQLDELLAAF